MKNLALAAPLSALLALSLISGCDKPGGTARDDQKLSAEDKAEKKKATVDALLRESGIDPSTLPAASDGGPNSKKIDGTSDGAQGAAVDSPSPSRENQTATGQSGLPTKPPMEIELLDAGKGPKTVLRYKFEKDRARKFHLDMEIVPKRVVNGQPSEAVPAVNIAMKGTSVTVAVNGDTAERENTFLEFIPSGAGIPPMMIEQMKAQFASMSGVQLMQTISSSGQILEMGVKEEALNNPQIMTLVQNLQDGMSNAFLPLPDEAVGVGAKWKGTTKLETSGLVVLQENIVHLKSLNGTRAVVELTFKQSAPKQELAAAGLPPGAKVELLTMEGGGSGTMTVDFATLITDSKVNLKMTVDTKISGEGIPEPVQTATDTSMKIHMRITP